MVNGHANTSFSRFNPRASSAPGRERQGFSSLCPTQCCFPAQLQKPPASLKHLPSWLLPLAPAGGGGGSWNTHHHHGCQLQRIWLAPGAGGRTGKPCWPDGSLSPPSLLLFSKHQLEPGEPPTSSGKPSWGFQETEADFVMPGQPLLHKMPGREGEGQEEAARKLGQLSANCSQLGPLPKGACATITSSRLVCMCIVNCA